MDEVIDYDYGSSLQSAESRKRYREKLEFIDMVCPYMLPEDKWSSDPTEWPAISLWELSHYMINHPGVFGEKVPNYKSTQAHQYYMAGWVHEIKHYVPKQGTHVFKAHVNHSQATTKKALCAWVAVVERGGEVIVQCAHCTCMAGISETCSHVGAILFKLEAGIRKGFKPGCTDVACAWNNDYKEDVVGEKVRNISLYGPPVENEQQNTSTTHNQYPSNILSDDQLSFLDSLDRACTDKKPICLSFFPQFADQFKEQLTQRKPEFTPERFVNNFRRGKETVAMHDKVSLPKPLREFFCDGLAGEEEVMEKMLEIQELAYSCEQIEYIEEVTRAQSSSMLWKQMRYGRITASVAYKVLHTKQDNPSKSLVLSICKPQKEFQNEATQHGLLNEERARVALKDVLGATHKNVVIKNTGLRLYKRYHGLGASCDGIMKCDCHSDLRTVEIKCPYKYKDNELKGIKDKNFHLDEDQKLRKNHPYYDQVQMQLHVLELNTGYFVTWTNKEVLIEVINLDNTWTRNMEKLVQFHKEVICRELITRDREGVSSVSSSTLNTTELYCYCQKPFIDDGNKDMVGCDSADCPYQWFHFDCVGLKQKPTSKTWYCKDCKKNKK